MCVRDIISTSQSEKKEKGGFLFFKGVIMRASTGLGSHLWAFRPFWMGGIVFVRSGWVGSDPPRRDELGWSDFNSLWNQLVPFFIELIRYHESAFHYNFFSGRLKKGDRDRERKGSWRRIVTTREWIFYIFKNSFFKLFKSLSVNKRAYSCLISWSHLLGR